MRHIIFFAMVWLVACNGGGPATVGGIAVDTSLMAAADAQAFDYTGLLDKALKGDAQAVGALLAFTPGSSDTSAANGHARVLRSLLGKLGDADFAKNAEKLPEAVRQQVWSGLERQAGGQALRSEAPLTLQALMPPAEPKEHTGLYFFDSEGSTFRPCEEPGARYIVVDETGGELESKYRKLLKYPYPRQSVMARLTGYTAKYHGSLSLPSSYAGFLVVSAKSELQAKNFRNTCIPYDFWALGTEPFWQAQVSAAEGVIEYRGMDDERTSVFTYQPPIRDGDIEVYAGVNEESGDNIRIEMEYKICSDGMSETNHLRTVRLTVNGKELSGCGIPYQATAIDSANLRARLKKK